MTTTQRAQVVGEPATTGSIPGPASFATCRVPHEGYKTCSSIWRNVRARNCSRISTVWLDLAGARDRGLISGEAYEQSSAVILQSTESVFSIRCQILARGWVDA